MSGRSQDAIKALFSQDPRLQESTLEQVDFRPDFYPHATPIHWAATNGPLPLFKSIVSSWNFGQCNLNTKKEDGQTPLDLAAKNGNEAIVKLLLATEGVDLNIRGHFGRTALSQAVESDSLAIVEPLIAAKGIDANSVDNMGRTPLSKAAEKGRTDIVKLLIAKKGPIPNRRITWVRHPYGGPERGIGM